MPKLIQININKDKNRTVDLINFMDSNSIDILALQEPHVDKNNDLDFFNYNFYDIIYNSSNGRPKAAVIIRKRFGRVIKVEQFTNDWLSTAIVQMNSTRLVIASIYFNLVNSDGTIRNLEEDLQLVQNLINTFNNSNLIILTDSNSRHKEWFDKCTSKRGRLMIRFINTNDLIIHNTKDKPTFIKKMNKTSDRTSCIDLSLTNRRTSKLIKNWSISHDKIKTEHGLIEFDIHFNSTSDKSTYDQRFKYLFNKTDFCALFNTFDLIKPDIDSTNLDEFGQQLINSIKQSIDASTPKIIIKENIRSQPWYKIF